MAGRFASALLALVMIGAPVVVDLCEASCARAASAPATESQASSHSCHDAAAASPSPSQDTLTALPHGCGHDDTLPGGALDGLAALHHVALVPSSFDGAAPPSTAARPVHSFSDAASPGADGRAPVPLRV